MQGIHRWPVNSPHKWPVTRKMFPFDGVIMTEKYWTCYPAAGDWYSIRGHFYSFLSIHLLKGTYSYIQQRCVAPTSQDLIVSITKTYQRFIFNNMYGVDVAMHGPVIFRELYGKVLSCLCLYSINSLGPGGRLSIKSYQIKYSHYTDKTVSALSVPETTII